MQVVRFPPGFAERYLAEVRGLMETGQLAEGRYFSEAAGAYLPGMRCVPLCSGGAGLFSLLAYHKLEGGRTTVIVQSNTMRALYTVPTLLGLRVQVVDSTWDDFLGMSPAALSRALEEPALRRAAVVVPSIIGGYLSPSFAALGELCRSAGVPLVVDCAHAHYLDLSSAVPDADLAYSFYATKVLPAGEGGLIATRSPERQDWVRRFVSYDRFRNELPVGLNLRASEATGALIHLLMADRTLRGELSDKRVALARRYADICDECGVRYLRPQDAAGYNGYKFVVRDPYPEVQRLGSALTAYPKTSGVFDTDVLGRPTSLPHWCPPTYSSLVQQ